MRLFIDKKLDLDDRKVGFLSEFCIYCAEQLPIEGNFTINVVSDRNDHGIKTTAAYMVGENTCSVYAKNRALPDVMRSIAHEMTHMMQDQTGLLVGNIRDAGGFHEDQANARAGELIKKFVKDDKSRSVIYESIRKFTL
jgi:hypothetical protein